MRGPQEYAFREPRSVPSAKDRAAIFLFIWAFNVLAHGFSPTLARSAGIESVAVFAHHIQVSYKFSHCSSFLLFSLNEVEGHVHSLRQGS